MTFFRISRNCLAVTAILAALSDVAPAQQRPFGPAARASRHIAELQQEAVRAELEMTEEQIGQVAEAVENFNGEDSGMGEFFTRLRNAESEEERTAIMEEMRLAQQQRAAEARDMLAGILSEEQMKRLDQIVLHRQGPAMLARPEVAESIGLSEQQQSEIETLVSERQSSLRGPAAFTMSREEREAAQAAFHQTILDVLDEDQLAAWNDQIGPPPPGDGRPPASTVAQPAPQSTAPAGEKPDDEDVVSSFEPTEPGADGEEKMSFNFKHAPWSDVLADFAERAGLTLDLTATPPGTFNYTDQRSMTPTAALDVLNGYLLQRGFILVKRDDFLVCINIDEGVPPNLIPHITAAELKERGRNELLTVVFPAKGVEVAKLAEQIGETLGPQGKAVGIEATQTLVVTDIATNLRRVHEMLESMAVLSGPEDVTFQSYPLQHVPAGEAEQLLRNLLGLKFVVQNVSAANERGDWRSRSRWGQQQGGNDNDEDSGAETSPFDQELLAKTQLTANTRTNQLLVTAPVIVQKLISDALESIDVEADGSYVAAGEGEPYLQVYQVSGTDAGEVTKTLDVLMPGVVVNEDRSSGKVHIFATAAQQREVAELIEQLQGKGGTQTVSVIPLVAMDPIAAAATVRAMFIADGDSAPVVEADLAGRQLMLRGTADQLAQVKTLLAQLGEDGSGDRSLRDRGPLRRFSLSGRNTRRLLEIIEGAWGATQANPIRVIEPETRGPIRDVRTPEERSFAPPARSEDPQEEVQEETQPELKQDEGAASGAFRTPQAPPQIARIRTQLISLDETPNEEHDTEETQPEAPAAPAGDNRDNADSEQPEPAPEIIIRIDGDELILMSNDQEALDRLELLLEDALQLLPPETGWTVFTLQSADAIEAANMLELLIPDSTVAETDASTSVLGTLQGFGSNLIESVGLDTAASSLTRLQIVPESRLNALFVSGPPSRIEEVSRFLEIIDAADWPGSKRDRVPRMIPVEHADVQDVHKIVSDVYADYLAIAALAQNPFAGGGRGGNPLSMLLGGGGGDDAQAIDAPLTIGIDQQTSNLIVSADEPLFQEIRQLVESIDQAAQQANRTIRVYSLQNANAAIVQQTLGAVVPRVQVSTTGSRPTTDRTPQPQPQIPDGNRGGDDANDQMRRFFEQRMRERFQQMQQPQQSGGNDDSGRRGFGGDRGRSRRGN